MAALGFGRSAGGELFAPAPTQHGTSSSRSNSLISRSRCVPACSCRRAYPAGLRQGRARVLVCAKPDDDDEAPATSTNALEATIRRKSEEVQAQLLELGEEMLEERLQSSMQMPTSPPHRMASLIADRVTQGHTVMVYEVVRSSPEQTSTDLANLAKTYVAMGADALCVPIDSSVTPSGLKDLFVVTQVVEIKETGASGCLGVIGQVNGRGTAVLSSFSAALGLDAPVEVVNLREVEGLAQAGVVFYGINISVGISVAIPGFGSDLAHGILGNLPFGAISMVGVKSLEEAVKAKASGADSILVKHECIEQYADNLQFLTMQLAYTASGDD